MQKLQNRKVALSGSTTLTQEQKEKFSAILQIEYMSSEESAEESGEDEHMGERLKVLLIHTLPWRNQSVNEMFQSLDRKKARKRTPRAAEMCRKRVPWGAEHPRRAELQRNLHHPALHGQKCLTVNFSYRDRCTCNVCICIDINNFFTEQSYY